MEVDLLIVALLWGGMEMLGLWTAFDAVMKIRLPESAVAWAISLIFLPPVAVPLYLIFGNRKLQGYASSRKSGDQDLLPVVEGLVSRLSPYRSLSDDGLIGDKLIARLHKIPLVGGNHVTLLQDGRRNFFSIFAQIESAERYLTVQYYLIRDDAVGREFQAKLVAAADRGVRVFLLYDEIGSYGISDAYIHTLEEAGVQVQSFPSFRRSRRPFQLNFRNHRKVLVADGRTAWLGGLNVGNEYLGLDPHLGPWRDTGVRITGPAVLGAQLAFLEDWYYVTGSIPELSWEPQAPKDADGGRNVLVLPSGPADDLETCRLFFMHAFNRARDRIWIASPYFAPDESVLSALRLAGLRGLDVRILLPERADLWTVQLASYSYLTETESGNVAVYRYRPGILHQKVVLVDDGLATVGTVNLDHRSFRINFETTVVVRDKSFAAEVEHMLERDFAYSRRVDSSEYLNRSYGFRLAARTMRLFSPVL